MKHVRSKMILVMLLIAAVISVSIYLITSQRLEALYSRRLYESTSSNVKQVMLNVDTTVKNVENSLDITFQNQQNIRFFNSKIFTEFNSETWDAFHSLDAQMRLLTIQIPQLRSAVITSHQGGYYHYNYYSGASIEELEQEPWYQSGMKNETVGYHWDKIYDVTNDYGRSYTSGRLESAKRAYFVVTKKVVNTRNMQPMAQAFLFLDPSVFSKFELPLDSQIVLFDNQGKAISLYDDALLAQATEARMSMIQSKPILGYDTLLFDDGEYLVARYKSPETGWTTVQLTPLSSLRKEVNDTARFSFLSALAILAVASVVIILWATRFSNSITQVAHAMDRVSEGDLSVTLHTTSKDEVGEIYHGFNHMVENIDHLIQRLITEEDDKNQAQMQAMISQIKPHFLGNTLGIVRMMALRDNNQEVAQALQVLSRLLRNSLTVRQDTIPLSLEIENLKDFVYIIQMRSGNKYHVSYDISAELHDTQVPLMLLQPFVENSFFHGFSDKAKTATSFPMVSISAYEKAGDVYLTITDNGIGMTQMQINQILHPRKEHLANRDTLRESIGIQNIHQRLQAMYGLDYGVSIKSEKGKYMKVMLKTKRTLSTNEEAPHAASHDC